MNGRRSRAPWLALLLAAGGCGQATPCSWTGSWSTNFNTMTLTQSGPQVVGSYELRSGTLMGTASGDLLAGTWSQSSSGDPMCPSGELELTMAPDCGSFRGKYWYCARTSGRGGGDWNGTRK